MLRILCGPSRETRQAVGDSSGAAHGGIQECDSPRAAGPCRPHQQLQLPNADSHGKLSFQLEAQRNKLSAHCSDSCSKQDCATRHAHSHGKLPATNRAYYIPIKALCKMMPHAASDAGNIVPCRGRAWCCAVEGGSSAGSGLTVVLKPSEMTLVTCLEMAAIIDEGGLSRRLQPRHWPGFGRRRASDVRDPSASLT